LGVYETLAPLGEDSTWNHLTRSHVRAVLALPAPARASLLREAAARGWTVQELESAASGTTRATHGGRRRVPAFVRAIAQAERLFAPNGPIFRDLHRAVVLEAAAVEDLHGRLIRLTGRVELARLRLSPKRLEAAEARTEEPRDGRRASRRGTQRALGAIRRDSAARSGASRGETPGAEPGRAR